MRIKNIYIRGFKSFMDKLNIQISPGISAFVGPNGCGKSNIVDAVRWAMGEQSPKQLRGRQMEDMIFSGAGSLKPLGMAEVILTLENGAAPGDASEISIARRLYRSGESEYLINNSPCRLKDIHDLLMDTGLGNRVYAIIAQGEISAIIEQKPEETRLLLEEAAGISKYKARREASLRKIALTKENLSRVEDILVEIKREMNSLKRQAGKARRYKEVNAEIRRLNLVLSAHSYEELQGQKAKKEKAIGEIIAKERELEARFSEYEHAIEEKNRELVDKERTLSVLRESAFSLREQCRRNEDAMQRLADDQQRFHGNVTRLNQERTGLLEKAKGFQSEITKIQSRVSELQSAFQEISAIRSQTESTLKGHERELVTIKEQLKKQRTHLVELATQEARFKGEIRNQSDIIDQVGTRKNELEMEAKEGTQRLENVSTLLREKRGKKEDLLNRIRSLERVIYEHEARREALEEAKGKKEALKAKAESDLNLLRTQLKTVKGLIESYEGYRSGVQTIMNTYGPETNNGGRVLGVLADFIKAEPEFEEAVEAVLDERMQYVIVVRQEDGREAVEYLRSKDEGRSYFLPLDDFSHMKSPGSGKVTRNGFPLLREHISVPERFKPVIEDLLGDAALVGSLSEALSAWNNGRRKQTLVTPEGDLVDVRGIIIGGRLGKDSVGLLSRRRRERELHTEIEKEEKINAVMKSEVTDLAFQTEKEEEALEQLRYEKRDYMKQSEEMERDIFLLERDSEQLTKHTQYIVDQLETLGKEGHEKNSQLKRLEEDLLECRKAGQGIQGIISEKEAALADLEKQVEDARESFSQILLRYNQNAEEERGFAREKARLEQFVGEMEERIDKVEEEIQSNNAQYESSLVMEDKLKEALGVDYQGLKDLEIQVNETDQAYGVLKQELRENEKESAILREKISEVREEVNEERIKEAEVDFQIKGILSQVSRETGINLAREYRQHLEEDFSKPQYEQMLKENTRVMERIGEVNLLAINDYEKLKERYEFIKAQEQDLLTSIDSLNTAIRRINRISRAKFLSTFREVDEKLREVFPILFNGGKARLRLIDETLPLESGVLVEVQPPGKRLVHMGLLSGGEKALAAMALLFAIYLIKPSPFIIMDEVDAPLDEANTDRFNELLGKIEKSSQVLMVTHNRKTMEQAARLYGVIMDESSVSKIVSVDLKNYH